MHKTIANRMPFDLAFFRLETKSTIYAVDNCWQSATAPSENAMNFLHR